MEDNFGQIAIGKRIKKARIEAGLTQYALYEKTGIATTQLSAYENGTKNAGVDNLYKIAVATNMTIDDLYSGSFSEKPVNISTNEGELIVNCIYALYKVGVINRAPKQQKNEYVLDGLEYIYRLAFLKYVELLDDLIEKLIDLDNDRKNYQNPDDLEKQYLAMVANKINSKSKKIN